MNTETAAEKTEAAELACMVRLEKGREERRRAALLSDFAADCERLRTASSNDERASAEQDVRATRALIAGCDLKLLQLEAGRLPLW